MLKFEVGKTYKTRSGLLRTVTHIDSRGGYVYADDSPSPSAWCSDGSWGLGNFHPYDLVEKVPQEPEAPKRPEILKIETIPAHTKRSLVPGTYGLVTIRSYECFRMGGGQDTYFKGDLSERLDSNLETLEETVHALNQIIEFMKAEKNERK